MERNKQFFDIIFVSLQSNCFFAKDLGLKRTLIIYDQHRQIVENQKDKVATIGFFDGVHRGHCCLIHQVIEEAKKRGLKSVLLTFPEHPAKVLRPDVEMKLLTIQEEKEELLATSGADFVAFLPFTRELAQLSAHDFMQQVLKEQLQVKVLVIGYDHRFGHNRDEGFEDYVRYGKELGIEVVQAKELDCGKHVSSSTIRKALAQGDVAVAQDYLGYPYFLEGEVVEAFHIGRKIGFPTANIHVSHDKLIPQNGVYAVSVRLEDGTEAYGMLNIGSRPTLDNGSHVSIEVHIFHFHENIYGKHLRISFLKYIRKEQKFDSLEELQAQLERDKEECEKLRMKNVE